MTDEMNDQKAPEPVELHADVPPTEAIVPELSAEEIGVLRLKAGEYDVLLDRFKRAAAEFQNSQKRLERDMNDRSQYAIEGFARELLPIADDLARAVQAAREHQSIEQIIEGLRIVEEHLTAVFQKHGIRGIEASTGQTFDPNLHEAISTLESDEHEPNKVVHEAQKGYHLHSRLLRPARVVVSKKPESKD